MNCCQYIIKVGVIFELTQALTDKTLPLYSYIEGPRGLEWARRDKSRRSRQSQAGHGQHYQVSVSMWNFVIFHTIVTLWLSYSLHKPKYPVLLRSVLNFGSQLEWYADALKKQRGVRGLISFFYVCFLPHRRNIVIGVDFNCILWL